uniref:Zinc finger, CCHC-type n=1 Tax=Tanacetum cinerariifolium TaxID=118510 RepID=A0A6L2MYZ4_TANCI|nr:hypothetical protein [Tanacetum cinerariifolium]
MAHPVQNINHLAFMSMFEREKLFRNNFNDWFCQLKLVLRVEKKMYVIEQPLPAALVTDSVVNMLAEWKAIYDVYNEIKGYVDQLERLGYVLPQDLVVGLILNGLTKYFARFVRNYNMHNMGKTIDELHAMLIEYENGLPKKDETPQIMMIKGDNCHYAPSVTRGVVLVHHLVENGFVQCFTDFGIFVSKNNVHYFNAIPNNGIYEIDMHDLVPNVNSIYNVSTKRAKHNLDSTYL